MSAESEETLCYPVIVMFVLVVGATLIGVPWVGWTYGYTTFDWTVFGLMYAITGLGITVGYHRLISHRSFECEAWVKRALLVAGGWALQNSALNWCADHIRHHAKCDQVEDPYNARRGFWHSHVGWLFYDTIYKTPKYESKLRKDPLVMWQHDNYWLIVVTGLALPFVLGLIYNGWIGGLTCFMLAGIARLMLVLNSTFCINSISHLWGTQPHDQTNTARDNWFISLVTFGEGYHNYHHAYQRDYRNGPKWYNFDPSKWLIFGLGMFGLASNLRRSDPS
jgi:stearoyl-CoA desaturase (Delta-9 desaturase)